MIAWRFSISCSTCPIASFTTSAACLGSPLRRAEESSRRRAPRPCSVSSCSSRAQRARSASAAAIELRRRSDSTLRRIATALAALAANALSNSSSSPLNLRSSARSNAASTPTASPRDTIGTSSAVWASGTPSSLGAIRSRAAMSAIRSDRRRSSTSPEVDAEIGTRRPRTSVASPALAVTTRSGPSHSMITTLRASISARPRLTISSSTRSSPVSLPTAIEMSRAASSPRTDCSCSARRRSETW